MFTLCTCLFSCGSSTPSEKPCSVECLIVTAEACCSLGMTVLLKACRCPPVSYFQERRAFIKTYVTFCVSLVHVYQASCWFYFCSLTFPTNHCAGLHKNIHSPPTGKTENSRKGGGGVTGEAEVIAASIGENVGCAQIFETFGRRNK